MKQVSVMVLLKKWTDGRRRFACICLIRAETSMTGGLDFFMEFAMKRASQEKVQTRLGGVAPHRYLGYKEKKAIFAAYRYDAQHVLHGEKTDQFAKAMNNKRRETASFV